MPWRLLVSPRARRDLGGLSVHDREAMENALEQTATDPAGVDLKKLSGQVRRWRLRVGRWRAILQFDNATGTINVLRVLSRDRAYNE